LPRSTTSPNVEGERVRPPLRSAYAALSHCDALVAIGQEQFEKSGQAQRRPVDLLDAARAGDDDAFRLLVDPHRLELHAHCYRMLGSVHDAEDAFQDAMLRAWRGLAGLIDGRRLRPWLYKIATNTCLDAIKRQSKQALPIDCGYIASNGDRGKPPHEPTGVEPVPYPDARLADPDGYAKPEARYEQREAVELAYIAALQHLPGRQRAVLILREVLGLSARDVARLLETTVPSVNSALQRARKTVNERMPEQNQQATLRSPGDERVRDLVQRFITAFETGDVDRIIALLG
jgi:RNA polymerase sigma-70 factor (ECF subfamily)